jgi:trehalose-6-phosphate synthase
MNSVLNLMNNILWKILHYQFNRGFHNPSMNNLGYYYDRDRLLATHRWNRE